MKTITILGIFLISALNADWQRVVGISDEPVPPQKTTIMSDSLGVCIQTVIYGFTEHDTVIDAKDFKRIRIPEEPVLSDTMSAGKPEIPFVRLLIAIPDSASLETKLYNSDHTEYDNYLIYPIPRVVFEDSGGCVCFKEIYTYDTTFFDKDTLYPGVLYELGTDGYWREQRVLEVFLYPIQFNPQQNRMYLHHELDLRIDFSGTVIENTMGLGPFEEIGREVLLNYQGIDREAESVPEPAFHYYSDLRDTNNVADYLIVMGTDFYYNETASYWLEQFAQWRVDHNGFEVGLVKMDDIYTQFDSLAPDSAAQLRHFLAYAYDHWQAPSMSDDHFAYCLFVGDWDYVPTRL
ncbi:MAG: C25 family peptidase propeptide domain-containing protein, partial [bacterium]